MLHVILSSYILFDFDQVIATSRERKSFDLILKLSHHIYRVCDQAVF